MPDNDKIRKVRAKLEEIIPAADERSSARELARWLAAQAQIGWTASVSPGHGGPLDMTEPRLFCAQFAACHALEALRERDTGHADAVAAEITDAWLHAPGVGEWIWEHLGEDAQAVADIADELAKLTAPAAEAVTGNA